MRRIIEKSRSAWTRKILLYEAPRLPRHALGSASQALAARLPFPAMHLSDLERHHLLACLPEGRAYAYGILRERFVYAWHNAGLLVPYDYDSRDDALLVLAADRVYFVGRG
jgi:hypothetical protein